MINVKFALILHFLLSTLILSGQNWDELIDNELSNVLKEHRKFVSLPNVPIVEADILKNVDYMSEKFSERGFNISLLQSETLPVFLAEKVIDPENKTLLFYFHLDGQPADANNWDQGDPFVPVLKTQKQNGAWKTISWDNLDGKIDPEWRIFGRSAADDKGPIMMMLTALKVMDKLDLDPKVNIKIILDLQEESSSHGFLSTLEKYKSRYAADYMIIMDGPAHNSNRPTLTFGCRGIVTFSITTYGAKLPQHSGHFGNYAPNPIFTLSNLLSSMKNESGFVTIDRYYDGIDINDDLRKVLSAVPDKEAEILSSLNIVRADSVGNGYQEAMQYPSLNIRHIETSWKGPGLKTVIPEYVTAHLDVRLVKETEAMDQIEKIKDHIKKQGYHIVETEPSDEVRMKYKKIVKFQNGKGVNAFRTDMDDPFGQILISELKDAFGEAPVSIRTMGGTVPIIPAINTLEIPAIIVPMVNMDNNQHNPNENLRIGNMRQGIRICLAILNMKLN